MHRYAQIDIDGVVVGVSELAGVVDRPSMIAIPEGFEAFGQRYENGQFIDVEPVAQVVRLSFLAFLRLFTVTERTSIRASGDPEVQDFLWLAEKAEYILLADSDTTAGLQYLETVGLIAAGRAAEILAYDGNK